METTSKAVRLCKQAAELGHAGAMCNLGWMYESGRGVEKDVGEAVRLYKQAVELRDARAMFNLGVMYESGRGVEKDEKEAVRLYSQAAELGNTRAMFNLGVLYETGRGVKKDEEKAVRLYTEAVKHGNARAMVNLGMMYNNGKGTEKNEEEAVRLCKEAAELGNARAMFNLGVMYESGRAVKKDEGEAVRLYTEAVKYGDVRAMVNLGVMYESGRGVKKDGRKAVKLNKQAVKLGDARAMFNLGVMYEDGKVLKKDEREAVRLHKQAVELGNADAMCNLGWMYQDGRGVEKNEGEAVRLHNRAIEFGHADAMCSLGWMYGHGQDVLTSKFFSSSKNKTEDGENHPRHKVFGVEDESGPTKMVKPKRSRHRSYISSTSKANITKRVPMKIPVGPTVDLIKNFSKVLKEAETFGQYLSLLAEVLRREPELFDVHYDGGRGPGGAKFVDFEQLLQLHGAAVYGKEGHGLHKRPIAKTGDSKLCFGISSHNTAGRSLLGRGNLELLIRPTNLSLGGMTLASLMLDSMEEPEPIMKWLASQVKEGNCLTEKLSGKKCGRNGPIIISLRLMNRCYLVEDMLSHMEVLGAFAKVSAEGSVIAVSERNAKHRRGKLWQCFGLRRESDQMLESEHVHHPHESNDQMKRIGDTHYMRLNNKHRIFIVHQNSREWILTEMSGGVEVLGSGGAFGITRARNPQSEEILRSNDGIPLIDLNHLKTYKIMSNGNPVDFPTKIKLMTELLGGCGLRLIAKNDGFYYSLHSQNTNLSAVQVTQKEDAYIELNGSQDEGIEVKVTNDGQKLYMRALHDEGGEFNIVEAHKDEIIVRQKKRMRAFRVVGSISPEEATIQEELRKLDERCCVAITGDVIIKDFVDVITENCGQRTLHSDVTAHVQSRSCP